MHIVEEQSAKPHSKPATGDSVICEEDLLVMPMKSCDSCFRQIQAYRVMGSTKKIYCLSCNGKRQILGG